MVIFSPQMLNTFNECQTKYYFKFIKKISTPLLEKNFIVGKNIHALAAYYLKREDISGFKLSDSESVMWQNLLNCEYFKLNTIDSEMSISAKIDDCWIGGRLDALVKNDSEEYFILDYKTGQIPQNAKYNFQTIVYLLACDRLIESYSSLNFVYINVKTGEYEIIKFSEELKKEYENIVKDIYLKIQKNCIPIIRRTNKCQKCPYIKICV